MYLKKIEGNRNYQEKTPETRFPDTTAPRKARSEVYQLASSIYHSQPFIPPSRGSRAAPEKRAEPLEGVVKAENPHI